MNMPLEPMIAVGVFSTSLSSSLGNRHSKDDPTIQYLYTSSLFQQLIETVSKCTSSKLIDLPLMEYDGLKTLASLLDKPVFEEAINDAKLRILTFKRKHNDSITPPEPASPTACKVNKNNDAYKAAMEYPTRFKQKKLGQKKKNE